MYNKVGFVIYFSSPNTYAQFLELTIHFDDLVCNIISYGKVVYKGLQHSIRIFNFNAVLWVFRYRSGIDLTIGKKKKVYIMKCLPSKAKIKIREKWGIPSVFCFPPIILEQKPNSQYLIEGWLVRWRKIQAKTRVWEIQDQEVGGIRYI